MQHWIHGVELEASLAAVASGAPGSPGTSNSGSTIGVSSTRLGQMVVNGSGRTVYLFEADKTRDSTCYNACVQAWPPVTTTGAPRAHNGASDALL